MRRSSVIAGGLAALMLVLSPITATATAATAHGISGLELFQGIRSGGTTYGTTFAGWTADTTAVPGGWVAKGTGGSWILSINYTGTPGPGVGVTVISGKWSLRMAGTTYSGYVAAGGTVTWIDSMLCGTGNATVDLTLVAVTGPGSVVGCLDDRHLATVFPPHVWGTVTLPL